MKFLTITIYKILNYLLLTFFIVGIGLTFYEFITGASEISLYNILFVVLFILLFLLVFIYTRDAFEIHKNPEKKNENKLLPAVTILNLILGIFICCVFIYALVIHHLKEFSVEEIIRNSLNLSLLVFGILKINHSLKTFRILKN